MTHEKVAPREHVVNALQILESIRVFDDANSDDHPATIKQSVLAAMTRLKAALEGM